MDESIHGVVLGVDIGGANIKYSWTDFSSEDTEQPSPRDQSANTIFPMWKLHHELSRQLITDLARHQNENLIACVITMTGELADCFFDRQQGVKHIVDHVEVAFSKLRFPQPVYYCTDGHFRTAAQRDGSEMLMAASNWHGLAQYVAQHHCQDGLLIDVGSTTTDLIPIRGGGVVTQAKTDFDRLTEGSLIYLGGERTSLAMLVDTLQFRGHSIPVMREHFATMTDVRLLLGMLPESESDGDTADGKPRTKMHSINRIARLLGLSFEDLEQSEAVDLAQQIHDTAKAIILEKIRQLTEAYALPKCLVLSGHNDDLISATGKWKTISLREILGTSVSRNAPAFAVASLLAAEIEQKEDRIRKPDLDRVIFEHPVIPEHERKRG